MNHGARWVAVLLALTGPPAEAAGGAPAIPRPPDVRGVALGLFAEDPGFSYAPLLGEIRSLGATDVELVVPWYQADVSATDVHPHPRYSPTLTAVAAAIDAAHEAGLRVLLFPIVRLEAQRSPSDWRGTLAPADPQAWFASYRRWLTSLAELAAHHQVEELSIGSELSTLDVDPEPWRPVVRAVRSVFHGRLVYSGNWDHYQEVGIYGLVDQAGLCGYFSLGPPGRSTPADLSAAWQARRTEVRRFFAARHQSVLFTELGYLSQRGSHADPWAEGSSRAVDIDEQTRCYRAFIDAWNGDRALAGVYFWNWYGFGGRMSGGYTPRGKPAATLIAGWFLRRKETSR